MSYPQKMRKVLIRRPTAPLGDVQDDRIQCPPKLGQQAKPLMFRKSRLRKIFETFAKLPSVLINAKFSKPEFIGIFHSDENPKKSTVNCQQSTAFPRGFSTIELLLVIAFFALMAGIVSIPLATLQQGAGIRDAGESIVNALRRAETQAMSGLNGDSWGVHFSDSDGCVLPASNYHVFRGAFFTSATDTIDTIELSGGARITSVSVGGGCDVKFSRFHGTATSTGTITVQNDQNQIRTVTVNAYGRVAQ